MKTTFTFIYEPRHVVKLRMQLANRARGEVACRGLRFVNNPGLVSRPLASGAIFEIVEVDRIAECAVRNRDDVSPEEGARCAQEMQDFLISRVLVSGSSFAGLLFDVRLGPPVFGPKTRESLCEMLARAEAAKVPVGVVVGDAAIQGLQFRSVCSESGPSVGRVFTNDLAGARKWVQGAAF
jgi:hypothetical protein